MQWNKIEFVQEFSRGNVAKACTNRGKGLDRRVEVTRRMCVSGHHQTTAGVVCTNHLQQLSGFRSFHM